MKNWETKDLKFSVSEQNDELGTFTGYASIFGAVDSYGDVVEPGAFRRTIKANQQFPMLWSHSVDTPIGVITAKEDKTGLKVAGQLNLDVQRAKEIRSLMKQGAVQGLSIGYQVLKSVGDTIDKTPVRRLQEIKLWEISPVVFQACPDALVAEVKADEPGEAEPPAPGPAPEPPVTDIQYCEHCAKALLEEGTGQPTPPEEASDKSNPEPSCVHLLEQFKSELLTLKNLMEVKSV